jgi:single-stranded-DNA-specific exonuclease
MNGEDRLFLEVRQSARGMAWRHRLTGRQEAIALAIAQGHGVSDIVARVLAARGVMSENAEKFLDPTIRDLLPDPASLTDMDKAAARIADAVVRRERIAIFGDYDVDGAASSALMKRFLAHFDVPAEIYIPDRIFEGYGPNPEAMRDLANRGASLIVTVDCGTNSAASIDAAKAAGTDVVVLDHHQVGGPLPQAVAVVNPNREDDLSGQGHLCAAGVTFLTLVQVVRELRQRGFGKPPPDLLGYLDLAALATVCDVVPLTGVNRAFVVKGLLAIRKQQNAGLAALARVSRIGEPVNAFHLAFLIGPRINAGGRIGDAALGSRLLATDDPVEAGTIAETLDRLNQERQAMEQDMLAEARAEADVELAVGAGPAILVTASDKWHPGIVGLLASRLKDHARRPAFAIAFNPNGVGTGSGRSVSGFDLGRLVRNAAAEGLIIKGGGHAMAAGITIERSRLGELRAFFELGAASEVSRLRHEESLEIDAALSAEGANLVLVDALDAAGPYGAGHAPPLLALPRHKLLDARMVGTGHIRADLQSASGGRLQAIAFRAVDTVLGDFLIKNRGATVHLAGSLSGNYWNGSRTAQFRIVDAAVA